MRRCSWLAIVVLALALSGVAACGGDDKKKEPVPADGTAETAGTDIFDARGEEDVAVSPFAITPPKLVFEEFTIVVEVNSTLGPVGSDFALDARVARGEAVGNLTWEWDLDGGIGTGDGPSRVLTFDKAGGYLVSVVCSDEGGNKAESGAYLTVVAAGEKHYVGDVDGDGDVDDDDIGVAQTHLDLDGMMKPAEFDRADTDLDGYLTQFDVDLIQMAVDAEEGAPDILWPAAGSLGAKVRLIHPALLDADAKAQMLFDGADPLTPVRGKPGYATFVVPPSMDKAGIVNLTLKIDGAKAAVFDFEILPPQIGSSSGENVIAAMEDLGDVIDQLPLLIDTYGTALELDDDEKAVLQGMIEVSMQSYQTNSAAFLEAFNKMEPEGRAAFESVALANGLELVAGDLQEVKSRMQEASFFPEAPKFIDKGTAATIMTVLCTALDVADLSDKISEINEIASGYLGWFDWWPMNTVPIVGQVIQFLSGISNAIGAITDIIGLVSQFLPEFGDLTVEAIPKELEVGDTTIISVAITVNLGSKLCSEASNSMIEGLMEKMSEKLSNRLGASIPLVGSAFKSAKFDRDNMGTVVGLVYDAISAIAGAVLDAIGVEDILNGLADAVCGLIDDPKLPLDPEKIDASCGGAGAGSWTCTAPCAGAVSLEATAEVCGEEKKGADGVSCNACNEDNCTGCCDATCVDFPAQTDEKCGKGGAPCMPCDEEEECTEGVCVCTSDCSTPGDKQCVGNDIWVCTQVKDAPPCNKLKLSEPCINGSECVDGECVGGCNAGNCEGCCMADGTCMPGTSTDYCGKDGETCQYCPGGMDECVDGECVCQPECGGKECGPDGCGGNCGTCPGGKECVEASGICVALCGNGKLDPGEDCESNSECVEPETCNNCMCSEAPSECTCEEGTLSAPDCDWGDKEQCSGWHSVCMENTGDEACDKTAFPDGTEFCAWGCCIVLYCG
jgi:hypothetical protein